MTGYKRKSKCETLLKKNLQTEKGKTTEVKNRKDYVHLFDMGIPRIVLIHERNFLLFFLNISACKCATMLHKEMRVGPSEPAYRSWLQTTLSCFPQRREAVSVKEKAPRKVSGEVQGDERKRTTDEVSK
jgi:hypothetical protein